MPMDQKIERELKVIKKLFQMAQNPEESAAPNNREQSMKGEPWEEKQRVCARAQPV